MLRIKKELLKKEDFKKFARHAVNRIINFEEWKPFDILGPHLMMDKDELVINCFVPNSKEVRIKRKVKKKELKKEGYLENQQKKQ